MDTGTSVLVFFTFGLVGFVCYKIGHESGVAKEKERRRVEERKDGKQDDLPDDSWLG